MLQIFALYCCRLAVLLKIDHGANKFFFFVVAFFLPFFLSLAYVFSLLVLLIFQTQSLLLQPKRQLSALDCLPARFGRDIVCGRLGLAARVCSPAISYKMLKNNIMCNTNCYTLLKNHVSCPLWPLIDDIFFCSEVIKPLRNATPSNIIIR